MLLEVEKSHVYCLQVGDLQESWWWCSVLGLKAWGLWWWCNSQSKAKGLGTWGALLWVLRVRSCHATVQKTGIPAACLLYLSGLNEAHPHGGRQVFTSLLIEMLVSSETPSQTHSKMTIAMGTLSPLMLTHQDGHHHGIAVLCLPSSSYSHCWPSVSIESTNHRSKFQKKVGLCWTYYRDIFVVIPWTMQQNTYSQPILC
jgi:hypothetical protein